MRLIEIAAAKSGLQRMGRVSATRLEAAPEQRIKPRARRDIPDLDASVLTAAHYFILVEFDVVDGRRVTFHHHRSFGVQVEFLRAVRAEVIRDTYVKIVSRASNYGILTYCHTTDRSVVNHGVARRGSERAVPASHGTIVVAGNQDIIS